MLDDSVKVALSLPQHVSWAFHNLGQTWRYAETQAEWVDVTVCTVTNEQSDKGFKFQQASLQSSDAKFENRAYQHRS